MAGAGPKVKSEVLAEDGGEEGRGLAGISTLGPGSPSVYSVSQRMSSN